MKLTEITFKKLYAQIEYFLKKKYNIANSIYTTASPKGQILSVLAQLFQLNTLNVQNVQKSFDLNDPLNNNNKTIKALAKIGQYNPARASSAYGSIKLKLKTGIDVNEEIKGGKIVFKNRDKIKNLKNNLDYVLDFNSDELTYSLNNEIPIVLNIVQGTQESQTFTGTGEINQSYIVNAKNKEIDNYRFNLYVNSELQKCKKHKFDLLPNEKSYVAYTSFSGGIDILFGNGNEGMIPPIGSIIEFEYILTDGINGNFISSGINEFDFIDMPKTYYGDDIDVAEFFNIDINTSINFGSLGDTVQNLKSILPYTSSNFVLAGKDQYYFFLKRLGIFSTIDIFTNKKNNYDLIDKIYRLAKQNIDLLNNNNNINNSIRILIQDNLNEIKLLRKMILTESGDNIINLFLIPDIRIYFGKDKNTNYFNIDTALFLLDDDEKTRILNYLNTEGIQIITNEVKIIDPIITRYVINITARLYDNAIEDNIYNNISNNVSDYFIEETRRDRIPPSDLIRILDGINGIDSVDVTFISERNENYHKEFLIKSERFYIENNRIPESTEIIMSDGLVYNPNNSIGLDPLLNDILINNNELPMIRGGQTDRYNNYYNTVPNKTKYSSINILILPERTRSK